MSKPNRLILLLLVASVAVLPLAGCGGSVDADTPSDVISISVETKTVGPERIEQYKSISSTVSAENEIAVIPKVAGTVTAVHVGLGDTVKAGDLLFEIDDTALRLQIDSANAAIGSSQAALNAAQAGRNMATGSSMESQLASLRTNVENLELQYNELVKTLEAQEALFAIGGISQSALDNMRVTVETTGNQLETARTSLRLMEDQTIGETETAQNASVRQAEAGIQQAQSALKGAQQQLEYTRVTAEIDGIVSACNVTVGSMASSAAAPMTIVSMDTVKILFNVSDDSINKLELGAKVYVSISAASAEPFEGVISSISPAANAMTKLYPVEMYIDNPDHLIKPGMFVSLRLILQQRDDTVVLPINAVIDRNSETFVYTVGDDNLARKTPVVTGLYNESAIEVVEGLSFGDRVVVVGQDFISDQTPVQITASS